MAFLAGAVIGKAILDSSQWVAGAKQVDKSSNILSKTIGGITKAAAAVGTALVAGMTAAGMAANDFNKEFANVTTLIDPAVVDVGKMKKELFALDGALGSAKDLTQGLYQALSASIEPAKAVEFVGKAAEFAGAALVNTNTAVDVITTGLNAYGLAAEDAGRISDVLFTTIKRGKTTGAELSATIGQVIPLAANMGVKFEELGAAIATMTRQGVKSAEATTQINAVMTNLLKPSEDLKAVFESLGIESAETAIEQDGLVATLNRVIGATDGSQEAMAELFPNVRALRGALALTGEGAKGFTDDLNAMAEASGATAEAFDKQEKTFETLNNNINKAVIEIGNSFLPMIEDLVDNSNQFFTDNQEGIFAILGNLPRAFELTFQLIGDILNDTFKAENFFKVVGELTSFISRAFIIAFQELPGILGRLLIGAVDVAAKQAVLVQAQLEEATAIFGKDFARERRERAEKELNETFDKLIGTVKDSATIVKEAAGEIISDAADTGKEIASIHTKRIEQFAAEILALGSTQKEVKSDVDETTESIEDQTEAIIDQSDALKNNLNPALDATSEVFKNLGESAEATFKSIQEDLKNSVIPLFNDLGRAIIEGGDVLDVLASSFQDFITTVLNKVAELLLVAGLEAIIAGAVPVGVALIAASGLVALGAGIVSGLGAEEEAGEAVAAAAVVAPPIEAEETGPQLTEDEIASLTAAGFSGELPEGFGGGVTQNITFTGEINSEVDIAAAMAASAAQLASEGRSI